MMRFLFSYIKSVYRNPRKNINILVAAVVSGSLLLLSACGTEEPGDQNEKFEEYTQEVFCNEVSSNTINLHYTLKNPEEYGITDYEVSLGSFESDPDMIKVSAENMRQSLQEFSYEGLNLQNRITFDILEYQVKSAEKNADYVLYEEPLGLVSGVQTQFPVVMSEYRFYDRQDVETYLELLEMTGEYFDSLIKFEREKADAGLFMADYALDTVLEQCRAFLDMGDGNYLYSTFADRIGDVKKLTKEEKSNYIQDNALAVSDYVFPAYEKLISSLEELRGSGENEKGLVNLPDGADYYELVVRRSTGSDRSVEEMEDLTRRQITDDLEAMEQVLGITTEEAQEAATFMTQDSAGLTLSKLQDGIKEAFPEAPDTALEVKFVPEEMEEHLSPAFYMIPAIDNTGENVIYINRAHMNDDLTLFTTLAHEGYPGHLYQTIYYESTDPDPVRSVMDFGGYVEGWATYAEMGRIHYEGWSRMDTVAFFSNYGITDSETIERIYELIIGSPGNYLKYYIGYVEFLELKKDWAEEKGTGFSQKEFHEAVLKVGPAPFDIVEKYMWEMEE